MNALKWRIRALIVLGVIGLVLGIVADANASSRPTYKQAAAQTKKQFIVHKICDGHHINDHYWRVGFCTGKYQQYPKILTFDGGTVEWTAYGDAYGGSKARIALAQGQPVEVFGIDVDCTFGCPHR